MTNPKGSLDVLMDRLSIRLVPCRRRRLPGQSHARGTMKEIRAAHGDPHLIFTLRLIRESTPNKDALWSETIGAVSDILAQRPDWQERPSELFDAFDAIDLNEIRQIAVQRRPWPVRATMRAMLYVKLDAALMPLADAA